MELIFLLFCVSLPSLVFCSLIQFYCSEKFSLQGILRRTSHKWACAQILRVNLKLLQLHIFKKVYSPLFSYTYFVPDTSEVGGTK